MKRLEKGVFADENILKTCGCRAEKRAHPFIGNFVNKSAASPQFHSPRHATNPTTVSEPLVDALIHPSGWEFHSFHRHILQENEIVALTQQIKRSLINQFPSVAEEFQCILEEWLGNDKLDVNGFKLHLPPMLFGVDVMRMIYKDCGALALEPGDALFCWTCQVLPEEATLKQHFT